MQPLDPHMLIKTEVAALDRSHLGIWRATGEQWYLIVYIPKTVMSLTCSSSDVSKPLILLLSDRYVNRKRAPVCVLNSYAAGG